MDKFKVDVPVALIFFNRPDTFEKVFDCVRRTKPSKLFLIQDGARSNKPNDKHNIDKCREICSHIDWECEVYKDFSEVNLGCGRRIFYTPRPIRMWENYTLAYDCGFQLH